LLQCSENKLKIEVASYCHLGSEKKKSIHYMPVTGMLKKRTINVLKKSTISSTQKELTVEKMNLG